MSHQQILPLRNRVNQEIMPIKEYTTLSRSPKPEPHHEMYFCVIAKTSFLGRWGFVCFDRAKDFRIMFSSLINQVKYRSNKKYILIHLFNILLFTILHEYTGSLAKWVECSPVVRETWVQSHGRFILRTLKMIFDTSLLNTQQYKVRI